MRLRRQAAVAAALASGALLAACGNSGVESTPAACLEGATPFTEALPAAPGAVQLDGGVPISDCLTEGQSGGELTNAGSSMVLAATQLNAAARRTPGGTEALELGYLAGAAERGASETGGIHADLLRRLEAAARFTPAGQELPEEFEKAYAEGFAAGRESG